MVEVMRCFGLLVDYLLCCLIGVFEVVQTERHGYLGLMLPDSVSVLDALIRVSPTVPRLLWGGPRCKHSVDVVGVPLNVRKRIAGREHKAGRGCVRLHASQLLDLGLLT